MKAIYSFLISAAFLLSFSACEEEGPGGLDLTEPIVTDVARIDTFYLLPEIPVQTPRSVIMEEFSGVQCQNCPDGASLIHDLQEEYGDRITAVTIHAGFFAEPYPESAEIFEIEETTTLDQYFDILANPAVVIDRIKSDGSDFWAVYGLSQWVAFTEERLNAPSTANLELETLLDEENNILRVTATTTFTETVEAKKVNLSLYLIEDQVVDVQLMPDGSKNDNYEHEHIVRDMFTPALGAALNADGATIAAGTIFIKEYDLELNANWNIANVGAVGVVSFNEENERTALQAASVYVQ